MPQHMIDTYGMGAVPTKADTRMSAKVLGAVHETLTQRGDSPARRHDADDLRAGAIVVRVDPRGEVRNDALAVAPQLSIQSLNDLTDRAFASRVAIESARALDLIHRTHDTWAHCGTFLAQGAASFDQVGPDGTRDVAIFTVALPAGNIAVGAYDREGTMRELHCSMPVAGVRRAGTLERVILESSADRKVGGQSDATVQTRRTLVESHKLVSEHMLLRGVDPM